MKRESFSDPGDGELGLRGNSFGQEGKNRPFHQVVMGE